MGPPFFQWIPAGLASGPTVSCSPPASVSTPLWLFLGSPSTELFPFLGVCLRWEPGFFRVSEPCAVSLLPHGTPLCSVQVFSSAPSRLRFTRMVSFPGRCRSYRVGAPGCLSSSPVPLLLAGASLSPLRVTLAHFTLFSCGRALRLPASFPISGLAGLGVGPRLCGLESFCVRSCFLLLLLGGLFLLALPFLLGVCPRSPWGPPFSLRALALILLSFSRVRLTPILTLSPSWSGALFLFLLEGAAPAFLPAALSVALRPLFPYQRAQCVQIFLLVPVGLTFLFFSSIIWLLFCPFLLSQALSSLSSCYVELRWVPGHLLLPGGGNARGTGSAARALRSPLWSLSSTFLFSRAGSVLSHRGFLTRVFPRFPLGSLCSLDMLAVSSLVFAATGTVG